MTPNLATLLEKAHNNTPLYEQRDGMTVANMEKILAAELWHNLLIRHGASIIEALEACTKGFSHPDGSSLLVRSQVYALLATLEREAGGQP